MASIYHYGTVQLWNIPTGEQHFANHLYYIPGLTLTYLCFDCKLYVMKHKGNFSVLMGKEAPKEIICEKA